jgi:hypothetical protein
MEDPGVYCEVPTESLYAVSINCGLCRYSPVSPQRPGFNPGQVRVGFVVDIEAQGQVFSEYFDYSLVSMIPPVLHARHLRAVLTRTNGCSLETLQMAMLFRKFGGIGEKCTYVFYRYTD